jgi:gliding motility-associated-like protein
MDEESLFFIPNTFTPNEDTYNQIFQPIFTDGFDPYTFSMTIYNRWGELIFESHDASIGWNGSMFNSGGIVQDGMYTWSIIYKKVTNAKSEQISGHVNVLR